MYFCSFVNLPNLYRDKLELVKCVLKKKSLQLFCFHRFFINFVKMHEELSDDSSGEFYDVLEDYERIYGKVCCLIVLLLLEIQK